MENNSTNSKCPNCGSNLEYDAKINRLKCVSCDSSFEVESLGTGKLDEEEQDYEAMLEKMKSTHLKKATVASLNCKNCGANLNHNENTTSTVCPFCGSSHIIETNLEEEIIPISGIVPFGINKTDCNSYFHNWIKGKFFAPNKFKNAKYEIDLYPVYLPFWTFDMECYTRYHAKRGDYEYRWVEKRDADGNVRREREREIRWSYRSGSCTNSFDDVMILGSENHNNRYYINKVSRFNFERMEKFNSQFLIGYPSEKISLPLEEGFKQAQAAVQPKIRQTIEWDVGGDECRILSCSTEYSDVTFKQVLVPIYNGIYSYNGKQYNFVVNGQTAKFAGGYPTSWVKIFAVIAAIIIFMATIGILFIVIFE